LAEHCNLFSNILQEGDAQPATDHDMRKNGQLPVNIVMATPKQIQWVPIASLLMWSMSFLINTTVSLSALVICVDLMWPVQL